MRFNSFVFLFLIGCADSGVVDIDQRLEPQPSQVQEDTVVQTAETAQDSPPPDPDVPEETETPPDTDVPEETETPPPDTDVPVETPAETPAETPTDTSAPAETETPPDTDAPSEDTVPDTTPSETEDDCLGWEWFPGAEDPCPDV